MIRPLMMAKRVPPSRVMEVTVKAVTGISVPPASCSVLVPVTRAVGTQLMGQNGLRLVTSNSKEDLFLVSMAGAAACSLPRASKIGIKMDAKVFIVFLGCWQRRVRRAEIAAGLPGSGYAAS